ncbi:MAG: 50S ribosomal protein L11 methyltransferase [Rubellimicrobium sp.]|nr:50S ribosomal protein L11 methyltransferase [Rubellimicrobium sp.]
MPVHVAMTTTPGQAQAEALAGALEDIDPAPYAVGVTEIEDGSGRFEVGAHFETPPDAVTLDLLAAAHGARPFAVSEVPDIDWVAHVRRELSPVVAGRFFVHGSHDADKVPDGAEPLLIEAAMAFGTGHHGTTLGCLRALERMAARGETPARIADIGAGTAVLAMAAARVWPGAVLASDIDPVAVEVAQANAAANGLADRILCIEAAGFDHPDIAARAPFDLVFANILKGPLIALAPDMASRVAPGGKVILSGILVEQADEVAAVYVRSGFNQLEREDIGDWATLVLGFATNYSSHSS